MSRTTVSRFAVSPDHSNAAVDHVMKRGFPPTSVEHGSDGLVYLHFAVADEDLPRLAQALPLHLSAKIGIVGGEVDFETLTRQLRKPQ